MYVHSMLNFQIRISSSTKLLGEIEMIAKLITVFFLLVILPGIHSSLTAQFIHTIGFECPFDFEPETTQYQNLGITFLLNNKIGI